MEKEFILKDWLLVEQDDDNTKEVLPNSFRRFVKDDNGETSEWKPGHGRSFRLLGITTKGDDRFAVGDCIITSPITVVYRENNSLLAITRHGSRYRLNLDDMEAGLRTLMQW